MTEIACVFIGSLRLNLLEHLNIIKTFKENFSIRNSLVKFYFLCDDNNLYSILNIDEYKKEISKLAKFIQMPKNINLQLHTTVNNYNIISTQYFAKIQELLKLETNLQNVIIIRNDLYLKLNDIEKYYNLDDIFTIKRFWFSDKDNEKFNNHFYIIPYEKFMIINFSDEYIINLSKFCWDTETLFTNLIKPNKLIDNNDVEEYLLNGSLKLYIKKGIVIWSNVIKDNLNV